MEITLRLILFSVLVFAMISGPLASSGNIINLEQTASAQVALSCANVPQSNHLISWWRAEGNGNDSVGPNNGGITAGTTFGTGKVNQAFSFDGVTGGLFVSNSPSIDPGTSSFTVDAWIFSKGWGVVTHPWQAGENIIMAKRSEDPLYIGWSMSGLPSGNFHAHFRDTSTATVLVDSDSPLPTNQWVHVAAVFDRSTSKALLYMNGQEAGSAGIPASFGSLSTGDPLTLGQVWTGYGQFYGLVDEVDYFNTALSQSEIQSIYNAGSAGKCTTNNISPVADAGIDQLVKEGSTVTLDGSTSSDSDGVIVSYSWLQTAGQSVSLINSNGPHPSFVAPATDVQTSLSFALTVTDDRGGSSSAAFVSIFVDPNVPPIANPGPSAVYGNNVLVTLDGSKSGDPDGTIVKWHWSEYGPSGDYPEITLNNADTAKATFQAPFLKSTDDRRDYAFRLEVTDDNGATDGNVVTITILPLFQPVAKAGKAQSNLVCDNIVRLDGSKSYDKDGTVVEWDWKQIVGPAIEFNIDNSKPDISFVTPCFGFDQSYQFSLIVKDNDGLKSYPSTVYVDVKANERPIAKVQAPTSAKSGQQVTLDASRSYDPDGRIVSYSWAQLSGGPAVDLSAVGPKATFTAPTISVKTTLTFSLIVTDNGGANTNGIVYVIIRP